MQETSPKNVLVLGNDNVGMEIPHMDSEEGTTIKCSANIKS